MYLRVRHLPWYLSWKGLLGTSQAQPLYFSTRFGIHTFGMQYPIDVLIFDSHGTIKKSKANLQPNRMFFWNPRYFHIVELPQGTIEKRNFRIGEKVKLIFL